jgi:subtilisin family serine protease
LNIRGMSAGRAGAVIVASALAAGVVAVGAGAQGDPGGADPPKQSVRKELGPHDVELLAKAEAKGARTVTLIVAADKGDTGQAAGGLRSLGAVIATRVDEVGYLRAEVPTAKVAKAAALPGVAAVDLDETIKLPDPHPDAKPDKPGKHGDAAGPGARTPADNPFMPTGETGAVAFKREHPTWDGRGVTIGILDSGIDLDNPWLKTTSTGERKIVDWFTATDPLTDGDASWRAMLTAVSGPTFTAAGATWTAPAGNYRFNRFNEAITAPSEPEGDVNRDGDTTDLFGVLYDPVSHDIRVDVNQNRDFTDDEVMRPYREQHQVGHFGTDNPSTAVRDQMPFVVEYREDVDLTPAGLPGQKADFVNIGIIEAEHGSHVAGITAANDILGNPNLDGAAPGAKLVSARACNWGGGCTFAALTDGMVELVVNRHVDVVNMSIGGLPALNDGNNARAELYNRLIHDFGVQLIFSAGNDGPGLNTAGDPGVATDVISVAASISKATWKSNYGSETRVPYQLHAFSSRGPREDGGMKPNVAAPGAAISTTPMWQPGIPVAEAGYDLPPGLQMLQGTSMASPETTGVAALLLSAAEATGRTLSPPDLRAALYTSANPIKDVPTYGQGNGLIDTNGAWKLLSRGVEARDYTIDAPVCTPISQFLKTPNRGTGIYNRCAAGDGGQQAGESRDYKVTITRKSGPAGALRHDLDWMGDDGTFSSAKSVVLPLNQPVDVTVAARPRTAGVHGAVLRVDDRATSTVDAEISSVVVAATAPAAPAWAFSTQGKVDRNAYRSYFVTVPEGAPALQVNLSGLASGSQTRFIAINPYGLHMEATSSLVCYANFSDPAACNPTSRAYENPLPGVWEIEVESRRTSPQLENPFELSARIQGVDVSPENVDLPSVTAGQPTPVSWSLKNAFGPVRVQGVGGPLGSAFSSTPTIKDQESQEFQVTVPAGATRFDAVIGNPSDPGADLDLFVLDAAGNTVGQSADGDAEEAVSLANPNAGTYTVRVDGFAVPEGTTTYDYRDVFFAPALGSVDATSGFTDLASGGETTINGTVTANSAPGPGRKLFGEMRVVTDEGATIGRGTVSIGEVK